MWAKQEMSCKTNSLFTLLPPPPPLLCSIKETNIRTPIWWYYRALAHLLLRCLVFWINSLSFASTSHLPIIDLLCCEQIELGLSTNIFVTVSGLFPQSGGWVTSRLPGLWGYSSVAQLCLTLCNPMNCSMPGLPVHHQLPELTQTHVHQVGDTI